MTLQNLCLDSIVENFERYFSVYLNSDDVNTKRKFEFLQRIYSQELANKLFEESEIEEKHADFVINKYLKSLDTKWFGNCSWKAVVAKMAEIGPKIKKIDFSEYPRTRPWHEIFCCLPNLEVMHHRYDCLDEIFCAIAEYCPNIQEIEFLFACKIPEGFKSLCKINKNGNTSCSQLKSITLGLSVVPKDAAMYLIKNLPSLENFRYEHLPQLLYALHRNDLPTIHKVAPYKFSELDLYPASNNPHYGDILKVCFTLCPNLKFLVFPVMNPQQLNLISELSSLETLLIDNCRNDLLDINKFLKLKGSKLTSLQLRKCLVSLATLSESCPSLNELHLVSVECDETPIPPFKNFDLLTIDISKLCVSGENVKLVCLILSASPKLESMTFKGCDLTSFEVKTAILKCCEKSPIKEIDLCCSKVEKQFILDILSTCHSLSVLSLESCLDNVDERVEVYKCAKLQPNNPDVFLTDAEDFYDLFNFYYDFEIADDPYDSDF